MFAGSESSNAYARSALRDATHEARGLHAVPGHVADDHDDPAVGGLERVVPVAADVDVDFCRPVRGRDLDTFDLRQSVGDDRRLQQLDDPVLGFEALLARLPQAGAFEGRCTAPAEVDRELDVAGPESFRARVADRQNREAPAGDGQGNEHARFEADAFEIGAQTRDRRRASPTPRR